MKNIKISILIPIYNTEKYIEKCINSILNQSLEEIEIIAINDGSIDNSLIILKNLQRKDSRIVIIDKKNEGVSKSRNRGLEIAKGKYILNIDSDDWIESNYCEEIYKKAEKNNLDLVITDFFYEYEKEKKIIYTKDLDVSFDKILTPNEYLRKFLKENFKGFNCNKLLKKDIIVKNNLRYKDEIGMMEDVLFLIEYVKYSTRIGKINNAYYHYVQHKMNVTKNLKLKHLLDVEFVFDSIEENFSDKLLKKMVIERRILSIFALILQCDFYRDNVEYNNFIKNYLKLIKYNFIKNIECTFKNKNILRIVACFPYKNTIILLKKIFNLKKGLR